MTLYKALSIPAVLLISACAAVPPSAPMPVAQGAVTVTVSNDTPGMNDYPIGVYILPGGHVLVTKHRDVSKVEGGFGLFGVLAANASGKEASKKAVSGVEKVLNIDMTKETAASLDRVLNASSAGRTWSVNGPATAANVLEVEPYMFFSPQTAATARIQILMKAKLKVRGSKVWDTRYVYYVPESRPIEGDNSWSANGGRLLKAAVRDGLDQIAKVMMKDASRKDSGWSGRPVKVRAVFAGLDKPLVFPGSVLEETNDTVIFAPSLRSIFYGINIMPRNQVELMAP